MPIRAAAMIRGLSILLSRLFAIYSVFAKLVLHQSPKGFAALIILITPLLGTLLFFLGLVGEYVGRIYEETEARPHYVIRRLTGGGNHREGVHAGRQIVSHMKSKRTYLATILLSRSRNEYLSGDLLRAFFERPAFEVLAA